MIRNLRSGFSAYLDERDRAQLKVFASVVRDAIAQGKSTPTTLSSYFTVLLDEQAKREEVAPARRPVGQSRENPPPVAPRQRRPGNSVVNRQDAGAEHRPLNLPQRTSGEGARSGSAEQGPPPSWSGMFSPPARRASRVTASTLRLNLI
jgi:hypothetical protein